MRYEAPSYPEYPHIHITLPPHTKNGYYTAVYKGGPGSAIYHTAPKLQMAIEGLKAHLKEQGVYV